MTEEFLQYIWKHSLYEKEDLKTSSEEKIEVLNPGIWNTDAGPDFFNSSIKIGNTKWAGNVEVHLKASGWQQHNHNNNPAYDNVILHVVLENDAIVKRSNGETITAFIPNIKPEIIHNYEELVNEKRWPACHQNIGRVDPIYRSLALSSVLIERLEQKTAGILQILKENGNSWNDAFYQVLAKNFGFKTNALPFEMLARSLPLGILAKHKQNLFQLEALLFGQSGLLNEQLIGDDYFLQLREEYAYLSKKYKLKGIEAHLWKFMRLRPANFPSLRIAQFAALIHKSEALLSKVIELEDAKKITSLFDVGASEYWDTHFRFNHPSVKRVKKLGDSAKNNLLINTVVPFMFVYGEHNNKNSLKDRALELLELLPAEANNICKRWQELGISPHSAFESQALIQLKNVYCESKKCLKCQLGTKVINRKDGS